MCKVQTNEKAMLSSSEKIYHFIGLFFKAAEILSQEKIIFGF